MSGNLKIWGNNLEFQTFVWNTRQKSWKFKSAKISWNLKTHFKNFNVSICRAKILECEKIGSFRSENAKKNLVNWKMSEKDTFRKNSS